MWLLAAAGFDPDGHGLPPGMPGIHHSDDHFERVMLR
jgi:hypothetical protein